MFDRALNKIITDGINFLTANTSLLKRFIASPGWTDEEIDKVVAAWTATGEDSKKPQVTHNFGRAAGLMPCYAVVLAGESETDETMGRSEGAIVLDELQALILEIEQELGRPVSANVRRFQVTHQIFTFADNPDYTLALYNVLKKIMLGADKKLMKEFGMESPSFSGMDLTQDMKWLPENAFVRVWQVVGYAHVLTPVDFDVDPFLQRFERIVGMHVNEAVIGVEAHITPRTL